MKGFLISFEGGEGVGKSTQMKRLVAALKAHGLPVVVSLQPGGTRIGKQLRDLVLSPRWGWVSPRTELLLYEADRAQHVDEVLRPALDAGKIVVCDRFADSSTVYQGMCRALGVGWTEKLNAFATDGLSPDLTILLDVPVEVGFARVHARSARDRVEQESLAFHRKVRKGFLGLARRHPRRFVVLDGTRTEDDLAEEILARVTRKLAARRRRR